MLPLWVLPVVVDNRNTHYHIVRPRKPPKGLVNNDIRTDIRSATSKIPFWPPCRPPSWIMILGGKFSSGNRHIRTPNSRVYRCFDVSTTCRPPVTITTSILFILIGVGRHFGFVPLAGNAQTSGRDPNSKSTIMVYWVKKHLQKLVSAKWSRGPVSIPLLTL